MSRRSGRFSKAPDFYDPSVPAIFTNRNSTNPSRQRRKGTQPLVPANALNTNSPILKADIQKLFANTIRTWATLSADTQHRLVSTFPVKYRIYEYEEAPDTAKHGLDFRETQAAASSESIPKPGTKKLKCPLSAEFIAEDEVVRRDVARFKRDVEEGYYLRKWQDEGERAMGLRVSGGFDAFIAAKAEREFGESSGDEITVVERPKEGSEDREMPNYTRNGARAEVEESGEKNVLKRPEFIVEADGETSR